MELPNTDRGLSLRGYPNLSEAAKILAVATSTLSRREDLSSTGRGERDVVLSGAEVMRLATIYRKRGLNDVAQELLDRAAAAGDDERRTVEGEIENFFEQRTIGSEELESFVQAARRLLPPALYEDVENALRSDTEPPPPLISGHRPLPEDG